MCAMWIMSNNTKAAGNDDRLTPERLWSMGRIGSVVSSPDGKSVVYTLTKYDIKENKGHTSIYIKDTKTGNEKNLTTRKDSESEPAFIESGKKIAYLAASNGVNQLWTMNLDGSDKQCISNEKEDIEGFLFSPDCKHVIIIHQVPTETSIAKNDEDLPKASGMLINDLMYKHWIATCVPFLIHSLRNIAMAKSQMPKTFWKDNHLNVP